MTMHPFGGIENGDAARFAILPVPYEQTTTYRKGTANGPAALLEASTQVETFDDETRQNPWESAGITTLPPVSTEAMPDRLADLLEAVVGDQLDAGRIPACLGGEHSISLGPIRAAASRHRGIGILQVDAHPDLRDEYEGTRYGHGCVMRRVLDGDNIGRLVQVGLRAVSDEDSAVMRSDERVRAFHAHEIHGSRGWIQSVIQQLPDNVYVSFDLDGLDPSVIPGTGTPEPGGLLWWDALALLRAVTQERRVVGFDVVELIPEPVSNFAAAKLVFKMLAYLAHAK